MMLAQCGLRRNRSSLRPLALGIVIAFFSVIAVLCAQEIRETACPRETVISAVDCDFSFAAEPLRERNFEVSEAQQQIVIIKKVIIQPHKDYTRVCIVSDGSLRYTKGSLSAPERVYFDIQNARLDRSILNKTFTFSDKYIKQVRAGQNQADLVRVVLDLNGAGEVLAADLQDAFGITIDLHYSGAILPSDSPSPKPASTPPLKAIVPPIAQNPAPAKADPVPAKSKAEAVPPPQPLISSSTSRSVPEPKPAAPPATPKENQPKEPPAAGLNASKEVAAVQPPPTPPKDTAKTSPAVALPEPAPLPKTAQPTSHGDRTLTRMLGLKIGRIVLDPGHGGQDKGTVGPGGLLEKDLVLAIAKELQKLLQERLGAYVVLTRADDAFVSLEDRTIIANQQQADLFVSIHANSSVIRTVSGVETYFLDFARTDSAREVAARENATSDRNIRDLQELVQKITQADKLQESRELASIIQKYLFSGVRTLIPLTANRGVRSAPFIVLIGARMPSVLVEISFISNPRDEKLLLKDANRQSLAQALFKGIEGYMKSLGSAAARNHQ